MSACHRPRGLVMLAMALGVVVVAAGVGGVAQWMRRKGAEDLQLGYFLGEDRLFPGHLVFRVFNLGPGDAELTFPSGREYDVTVYQGNRRIWSSSDGLFHTMAVRAVTMLHGDVWTRVIALPPLEPGSYRAEAHFDPAGRVVAECEFAAGSEDPGSDPLEYRCYQSPGDRPEICLEVINPAAETVTVSFSSAQTHDFVLLQEDRVVWQLSRGLGFAQVLMEETLEPGGRVVYSSAVPELEAGSYRVLAYFAGSVRPGPAAETVLVIEP